MGNERQVDCARLCRANVESLKASGTLPNSSRSGVMQAYKDDRLACCPASLLHKSAALAYPSCLSEVSCSFCTGCLSLDL